MVAKFVSRKIPNYTRNTKNTLHNFKTLNKSKEILYLDLLENCLMRDDTKIRVKTKCNHMFCEHCLQTWLDKNCSCPYCRGNLDNTLFQPILKK